ncbi:5'-nucleotidase C-terminal domain-containing protein [Gleimia sp. 6138-11-ORH1]|uniref:5'-nucleotidase C-terminal domain-containing protein n=1 Tax=Gleimia sp. 6138-11-ORH1 TaxID=2973937 RepID=UPI002167C808|nr:5'-nucleotidase C-terminal domain-containing protein [Gleimia sp. 6138-11-ORH1]MCS4484784.1 5'-nucleotidase C-terminal domain-containing protein [Gleimia sp. 6138-11-ORH1]
MKKQFLRSSLGVATAVSLVAMPGLAFATEADPATDPKNPTPALEAPAVPEETTPTTPTDSEPAAESATPAETAPAAEAPATPAQAAPAGDKANPAPAANGDETVVLDLYNLTDIHGHIELVEKTDRKTKEKKVTEAGLPAMQCYLANAYGTNPNSSFTLLGDNIGATPFTSGALLDNPTIEALNEFPVVASTIGNHELDLGQAVFKKRVDGSAPDEFVKIKFPYLGANVDGMGTYQEGSETLPYLGDYKIANLGGVKVAFIGAIAQDVPYKLSPEATAGLTFNDPIAKITGLAKQLKEEGKADLVVAMLDDDVKNNYPAMPAEVDVIMGGDTHVPYEFDKVDSTVKLESANPKLAGIASGSYTDNLGLVRITYNKTTKTVEKADSILIPAAEVVAKADADCVANGTVGQVVARAVEASKEAGNKVVVDKVNVAWHRGVYLAPGEANPSPGSNRGIESTFGNLVADSILDQVTVDGSTPVDIGVVNAGGLRADLVPNNGVITYADTFKALPFSNELGYSSMTGAQFKQALENQWKSNLNSQNSRPMLRLLTSSNLTYTYDPTAAEGNRITSILLNGKPMDMAKTYNVGSMTFVLHGGDGYFEKGMEVKTFGVLDRDGFNNYLKKVGGANLKASNLKRGVGLSEEKVTDGIKLNLRGLSFSEGPGITKTVKVTVGTVSKSFNVDNTLLEPNASSAESVITTDGAGQATAAFSSLELCSGLNGKQKLPLSVATEFGDVITPENQFAIEIDCGLNPQASVKVATLHAGDQLSGEGTGFTPGGDVRVELHSKVYTLGVVKADANGRVTFNFKVPADITVGKHHVVLTDVTTGKTAKVPVEIVAKQMKKLPNTGADSLTLLFNALGIFTLGMFALGGGLLAARKRS